jgi:hypothetical protein
MNLGPVEVLIILVIVLMVVVSVVVAGIFLARNKGLDDSHGDPAYPPGWEPPPATPPPPGDAGPPSA